MLLGFKRRKKENFADSREKNAARKKRKTISNDIVTQKFLQEDPIGSGRKI